MHSEVFLYWLFQFVNRPFSSTTETNFMKKFNFAALLPGFLALNNSVWASDSSTGANDLPGMTLNEHDLVIAPLTPKFHSTLQGIAVIAPIEAIVLTDHHQVAGTMVAALLIIQNIQLDKLIWVFKFRNKFLIILFLCAFASF